jgi:flagellar hook assembly protein FlgD
VSFKGDSTKGEEGYKDLIVYPNPVKPGYTGEIRIKGLSDKSNIKITDINSNVIYETTSSGGMATWNGKSFDGSYVGSGVYLIFVLSEDGQQSAITKLLIVR